jgi:hypothetical protein
VSPSEKEDVSSDLNLSQSAVSSLLINVFSHFWAKNPATPPFILEVIMAILLSGFFTLLNFRWSCIILHQLANLVLFPEKIPGSPMSHAFGLVVSVTGAVIACSWVFFPLDSFPLDSAICSFSSSLASSSASWSSLGFSNLGSSGSVSCLVLVLVSVSKISGSLCSVSGRLVLLLWVLVCRLIGSGLD